MRQRAPDRADRHRCADQHAARGSSGGDLRGLPRTAAEWQNRARLARIVQSAFSKDYGAGLARIIGNLTARYSLGFALRDDEKDDGRLHQLDLHVKALDAKGKPRKLEVSARKGYYMPKSNADQTSAAVK